jgi:hypothetical protein
MLVIALEGDNGMADYATPNVLNYQIGKGAVYFTKTGEAERHLGNVAEMEIELTVEELEHFSSQEGTRVKDLTVVLEKSCAIRLVMEEWTQQNLAIALLGSINNDTSGADIINIGAASSVQGSLRFVAANDVGPKWDYLFPSVSFRPDGAIAPISDEWGQLEISGEVNAVSGVFGTATLQDSATTDQTAV